MDGDKVVKNKDATLKRTILSLYEFSGRLSSGASIISLQYRKAISERTLYIKLKREHTPKGEVGKNYLVCYSTFRKKETSCKKIIAIQTLWTSMVGVEEWFGGAKRFWQAEHGRGLR